MNKTRAIIIIELMLVLILCIPLFGKKTEFMFDTSDFSSYMNYENPYQSLYLGDMKPGAYTVEINYSADNGDDKIGNFEDNVGILQIKSENSQSGIIHTEYSLTEGKQKAWTKFWLKSGFKYDDVRMNLSFNGYGDLVINSIEVKENTMYRLTSILKYMLFFFCIDAVYMFFASGKLTEKKKVIGALTLIVISSSLLVFVDFFHHSHDINFHMARIASLADGLKNGQFPNRIQHNMMNGYSYINPLMYGELLLYLPAILCRMSVPLYTCYHVYQLLVNSLTAFIAFYCFSKMFKENKYGVLAAFLMCFSSYRFTNFYVRAAVGEYTAFMYLPLLMYGFWKVYDKEKDDVISFMDYLPILIALSGIIQSHILSCEMVAIFIIPFVLINYKKTFAPKRFIALVKCVGLIALLNAWFLVPFLNSMKMDLKVMTSKPELIQKQGLYLTQIFSMFHTDTGYSYENLKGDMPLSLGTALTIGIILFIYVMARRNESENTGKKSYISQVFYMGIVCIAFSLKVFPWDAIANKNDVFARLVGTIQYPWRYLTIATVCFIFVSIYAIKEISKKDVNIARYIVAAMVAVSIISEGYFFMAFGNGMDEMTVVSEYDVNTMMIGGGCEYMLDGTNYFALKLLPDYSYSDAKVISQSIDRGVKTFECVNISDQPALVTIPVQSFDNYHVYNADTNEEYEIINGENNNISVWLDAHFYGKVLVKYEVPVLWRICEIVSLLTLVALIVIGRKRNK